VNRPIRRVAVVVMLMFGLLLANGTYMTLFRDQALAAEPQNRRVRDAEFAQDRGAILAAGKTEIATTDPVKDRFRFQRSYPAGSLYAPVTGYYSYDHASSGLESTYNSQLAGTSDALFVRRLIDLATDKAPRGASVQTTIVPAMQEAAAQALGRQKGAVVALASSGRDRGDGRGAARRRAVAMFGFPGAAGSLWAPRASAPRLVGSRVAAHDFVSTAT